MKNGPPRPDLGCWRSKSFSFGFTLTNLLVSTAVFALVIAGVVSSHLFGLKVIEQTKMKMGISDDIPRSLNLLISDIRSAKLVKVGQGSALGFTEAAVNSPQCGNAIQIHPGTNTVEYVRYFLEPATGHLLRKDHTASSAYAVAEFITNSMPFCLEDYNGTMLTNKADHGVIGLNLQFSEIKGTGVRIGPDQRYQSYQLTTKVASRTLD